MIKSSIVVLYQPDQTIINNLLFNLKQLDQCIVVINDYKNLIYPELNNSKFTVVYNKDNLGVATALNQGITKAKELAIDDILLLDQDSTFTDGFVDIMYQELATIKQKDNKTIGLFPQLLDKNTGNIVTKIPNQLDHTISFDAYTYGCLLNVNKVLEVGGFDDRLFIYHVDTDFNLRTKNFGYNLYQTNLGKLLHSEGQISKIKFFGKELSTTNHSKLARYYMSRNEIFMLKRYFLSNFLWSLGSINWFLRYSLKALLFEDLKLQKSQYVIKGIYHGIIGKNGRYE